MKKLYDKSELGFALVWIGIYCVGMSIFDEISRGIGVESSATAVFALTVSLFLFCWMKKNNKLEWFGLCKPTASAKAFLFYIPLIVLTGKNLWGGAELHYDAAGPQDMGKVMGVATKQLAGRAEGRAISACVKELLTK